MSRHSKHSNDRSFYSAQERADAGFSVSKKEVLGTDCFLPFGHCALSLKAPKEAVATPQGYIYDREFILEYLLTQKLELQAAAKKYEDQEKKKAQKVEREKQQAQLKEITDFEKVDQGLLSADYRHKRALEKADEKTPGAVDDGPEKRRKKGELLVVDKAEMRKGSFWAAQSTQSAAPAELKPVDTIVKCPMSGKKLKVKDLIPVKFEVTDQKMMDRGGDKGVFCCAVSKHPITHQKAVLIKPSGVVVLESVVKDMVLKDLACPITGKKLKGKEDLLNLQAGGTGFSAHNKTTAKAFSMMRSYAGDNARLQGHLPRAGYAGLR
jgi:nitric oxide synthase-interacting protein